MAAKPRHERRRVEVHDSRKGKSDERGEPTNSMYRFFKLKVEMP